MVSEKKDIRDDFRKAIVFVLIVAFFGFISFLALTTGKGIESEQFKTQFLFYILIGAIGLVGIVGAVGYSFFSKRRFLFVPLHDPEDSLVGRGFKITANPLLLFLWTFVVFAVPLFIAGKYSQTFFSSIPKQQVTEFATAWGGSVLPALAENLISFLPIIFLVSFNRKQFFRNKPVYWFNNLILIPLIMGLLWRMYHVARYGGDELSLFITFLFGFVGVLITLMTMSFIPWAVIHFLTNFMVGIREVGFLGSDLFVFVFWISWIVVLSIAIWLSIKIKVKRGYVT